MVRRQEVPLPSVGGEVFQRRVEVVADLKLPFCDAKAPRSVRRPHPNEPSDGYVTLREHELLSRAKLLQQFGNWSCLLHFHRSHVGTIAACERGVRNVGSVSLRQGLDGQSTQSAPLALRPLG